MVADVESLPLSFFPHRNRLPVIWGGLFFLLLSGHLFFLSDGVSIRSPRMPALSLPLLRR
jgi:hypothetical protein